MNPRIDRETLHDKLKLFGTVVALMCEHPETFCDGDYYALQALLYETGNELYPEASQPPQA